jgi:hypothetical protein
MSRSPASLHLIELGTPEHSGVAKAGTASNCSGSCARSKTLSTDLKDAYERGIAAGERQAAARLSQMHETALLHERQQASQETQRITGELAAGFADQLLLLQTSICAAAARALTPLVDARIHTEAVESLASRLRALLDGRAGTYLEISGPEIFLAGLRPLFAGTTHIAVFKAQPGPEVRVMIDRLQIETQIGAWLTSFEAVP